MSPSLPSELVQRQIQERVAQEQERLAREAQVLLQQGLPGKDNRQMQQLLAAALEAQGPTILMLWIRYQRARNTSWWREPFTSQLLQKLEALARQGKRLADALPGADENEVVMELFRVFIGYLVWWHRALTAEQKKRRRRSPERAPRPPGKPSTTANHPREE